MFRTPHVDHRGCSIQLGLIRAAFAILLLCAVSSANAQETAPGDVVDFKALIPVLPGAPEGWTADDPEGSTEEVGETKITNVHRDYRKADGDGKITAAISILDSASNPDYVAMTIAGWEGETSTAEGYAKSVNINGVPGFETFENDGKHGSLWLLAANRYFVQIETMGQDSPALQEWAKLIDLRRLASIK